MPAGIEFCLLRPLVVRVPLVAHRSRLGDPALSSPASRFRSGSVTPGTAAGLVTRARAGRVVLYQRTETGAQLTGREGQLAGVAGPESSATR